VLKLSKKVSRRGGGEGGAEVDEGGGTDDDPDLAVSVLYISLLSVSVSVPVCFQSMKLVTERIGKRNIYSQLPTIGGTGLFRVAY
jgi:hypothetical protein